MRAANGEFRSRVYTDRLADGEEFVGTPTTICPVDKKEYR